MVALSPLPKNLKLFGVPIIGAMTLQMVEAKGEDLDDDLKEDFLPVLALINRTRVGFLHG